MRHGRSIGAVSAPPLAARRATIALVAAAAALMLACGGRAQDTEEGDLGVVPDEGGTSGRGGTGSSPRPSGSTTSPGAPSARRDGEICYSPDALASTPGLQVIASFLPEDAFDGNGCLSSEFSQWVDGGGCNYDPRPAVVRGGQCCHLLDTQIPDCG